MAFKKTIKKTFFKKELVFADSYIRIDYDSGNKDLRSITVTFYVDENKDEIIERKSYTFKPNINDDSENFIKQGYIFLKTLDEFNGVIDV